MEEARGSKGLQFTQIKCGGPPPLKGIHLSLRQHAQEEKGGVKRGGTCLPKWSTPVHTTQMFGIDKLVFHIPNLTHELHTTRSQFM